MATQTLAAPQLTIPPTMRTPPANTNGLSLGTIRDKATRYGFDPDWVNKHQSTGMKLSDIDAALEQFHAESLQTEVDRLRAENAKLKTSRAATNKLTPKVSLKGALSVYGLGRFPVTLYAEQWVRLLAEKATLEAFMLANSATLKSKGE